MSTTINTDLTLEAISGIYNKDKFYVKIFKELLNAAITDDFSNLSKTSSNIKDLFYEIKYGSETKIGVKTFIENEIYEKVFSNSTLYEGLISSLIDIYSVMYTIIRMRRDITDISIQPDEIVDTYLDSFGFNCKELFNYIQRREIVKIIYWYLRRKGTPNLLVKFLDILGFNYFFISEFELCEEDDGTHKYVSRLIYEQKPENDLLRFFNEFKYNYSTVKEYDPLLIKSDSELSEDYLTSYPSQSSYYQIGISVTYPELEYRISAFSNAMIKKLTLEEEAGEDIFTCKVSGYDNKVSYISLLQAYTYILGEYFDIKEIDTSDLKMFGWNKDVSDQTPLEIMYDIEREIKKLFILIPYNDSNSTDSIKDRKEQILQEIEDVFYVDDFIYKSYYDLIQEFKNSDPNFKDYIDSILLTEAERIELIDNDNLEDLEKNIDNVFELLDNILESMEYFIFDNTSFMIPVKNLILSYEKSIEILKKLDKYYTPYHAKLLFPQIVWMIRDLPGDIVALDDSVIKESEEVQIVDVVMRANNYKILDQNLPEPYAPIMDWKNEYDNNPHIPTPLKYMNDLYYDYVDVLKLQSENDLLYVTGYDWRNLSNYPLIVRSVPYQLYTDWDPDIVKSEIECKLYDKLDFFQPDDRWIEEINKEIEKQEEHISYYNTDTFEIIIDKNKDYNVDPLDPNYDPTKDPNNPEYDPTNGTGEYINGVIKYEIEHNYDTKDVFVEVYNKETGQTIDVEVEVIDNNHIVIRIKDEDAEDSYPYNYIIDQNHPEYDPDEDPTNKDSINYNPNYDPSNTESSNYDPIYDPTNPDSIYNPNNPDYSPYNEYPYTSEDNQSAFVVIISAPLPPGSSDIQKLNGELFKIIDIGYLKNFMCITSLSSKDLFWEMHHRRIGQNMIPGLIRKDNNIIYVSMNNLDVHSNDEYTLGLIEVLKENDTTNNNSKPSLFGKWIFRNINIAEQSEYIIEHNFGTANIITRIYDLKTGLQVHALVEKLDAYHLSINFSKTLGSGSYKVILMGTLERFYQVALPLNNLTGYSEIIKCDGINNSYIINHNLNSLNTFEQMIEKDTGEIVNVNYDRLDSNRIKINIGDSYLEESTNKEYIINIFAPLDIFTVKYPSTIYNTSFESFTIKYDPEHPRLRTYQIEHNMNNDKVVVQIYDSHNRKVYGSVNILDKNSVKLVLGKSITRNEYLRINILSLPDTTIPLTNFDENRKSNHFINMYDCIISKNDITKRNLEIYEGGDSTTEVYDKNNILYFGNSSTNNRSSLSGGKSNTAQLDDGPDTFIINHNMSTEAIIVNVFNERTKETVDAYIAINNSNSITVGIDHFNDLSDDLHVVIIGALRSHIKLDNKEHFDVDYIDIIPPYQYTEIKYKESDNMIHHISNNYLMYDIDYYENSTPRLDGNIIREGVDIIHEIKDSSGNITTIYYNNNFGFNKNDILTNDPVWDKNVREDVSKPYLQLYSEN